MVIVAYGYGLSPVVLLDFAVEVTPDSDVVITVDDDITITLDTDGIDI